MFLRLLLQSIAKEIRMITTCSGQHGSRKLGEIYRAILLLGIILVCCSAVFAQVETATVSGVISDQSGGIVVGAEVQVTNSDTNITSTSTSNQSGVYLVTGLRPGRYRIKVTKDGFKGIDLTDLILNVQDLVSRNFILQVGSTSESMTVKASALSLNTENAAVSTVVDREFVENMPLNGRSFQTLITLTPGVVLTPAGYANGGQFSVNGQRSDGNYFAVDGVSANIGIAGGNGLAQSSGGSLPGFSALGGTNTLVSVDAMQEFRIQTSSFAPEFGRTPGGQISVVTRTGTNDFHGTLFDYFRNDVLDAKDWFVDRAGLMKPPDRQNDFGGVIGGPIYKNKTFFFFSYEGLRLRQPQSAVTSVPDATARQNASAPIQPFLNAFPIQNGPELGNEIAQFSASYSNSSTLNAYSLRVDHNINSRLMLFGRYNYAPSQIVDPSMGMLSDNLVLTSDTQTLTLGLTGIISNTISNELRANYSNYRSGSAYRLTSFGGAVPLSDSALFPAGFSSGSSNFDLIVFGMANFIQGKNATNEQRQVNFVDTLSLTARAHQTKFGVDYRWLAPFSGPISYGQNAIFFGLTGPAGLLSGNAPIAVLLADQPNALLLHNFSAYGQDTWKATGRLTLTYGLRWDINPPLSGKDATSVPFTVVGLNSPATLSLAPRGTPLYSTTYGNVAPRLGVAYQLRQAPGWESVVRGGIGLFYDLGTGSLGSVTQGFPYTAFKVLFGVPFPIPAQQSGPPPFTLTPSPSTCTTLYVAIPDLSLPRTYQWNVALEQSLGTSQTLSLTYIGALGRDLLRPYFLQNPNADFAGVYVTTNTGSSDYHALQFKYQRRLARGLQALASYTYSHSIDNASDDSGIFTSPGLGSANVDRGSSDFDVRHSFTGALTYNIPSPEHQKFMRALLGGWSANTFVFARSALPVNVYGTASVVTGIESQARPDLVPGIPLYLYGPQFPGGKAFNNMIVAGGCPGGSNQVGPFCPAPASEQGNFGRNVLRGFGAWQADFALARQFHLAERLGLQFRAEFFNILNHPNFGDPSNNNSGQTAFITSPLFGQSTGTLASSLGGNGGFNPLYQVGGPRSIQLAMKLSF